MTTPRFRLLPILAIAGTALAVVAWLQPASRVAAETAVVIPPPAMDAPAAGGLQTIVIAGGCFWGVQAVYQHTKGVTRALSGYAGGAAETAHYREVGSGRTGHAEAVEVQYDPREISLGKLLQIFFSVAHDPTQLNRQGPDWGPQYRSAIFFADESQRDFAAAYIAQLDKTLPFGRPIVTKLEPLNGFYPAEDYHQDYATLHPHQAYIFVNDLPKIDNLERLFPAVYRETPVLIMAQ